MVTEYCGIMLQNVYTTGTISAWLVWSPVHAIIERSAIQKKLPTNFSGKGDGEQGVLPVREQSFVLSMRGVHYLT